MRVLHYADIENAHDDPERIARLAGLITQKRDADAVVCGSGDNIAPGVLPLMTRGEQALDFYEAVSPTLATFGNHDFDYGLDRTRELVAAAPHEWISANIYQGDARFADVNATATRTHNGVTVGFIGVTDPATQTANPQAAELTFTDPFDATRTAVQDLTAAGVDHIVVLSHVGRGDDDLAQIDDVDVILGGHVHAERTDNVNETQLIRPGSGGDCIYEVDLPTDAVTRHPVVAGPVDEALYARYIDRLAATGLDTVVGEVDTPIRRREQEAFRGESRVGNFVADAYRWAATHAVDDGRPIVGLQNSGGIRTGPPLAGDITLGDLVSLVPFEEPVVVLRLSGSELRETFREAAATPGFGEEEWWHAHIAGARLVYDVTAHTLRDVTVDGDQIMPAEPYRLATTEFLLHTPEEFPTLTGVSPPMTLDTQYEVLAEYARTVGINPTLDGRIVRVSR